MNPQRRPRTRLSPLRPALRADLRNDSRVIPLQSHPNYTLLRGPVEFGSCTNVGSNTQTYAARAVSPLLSSASSTLLTIPGLAHIRVYECLNNQAAAVLVNDDNADLWFENSSEADYDGSTWSTSTTSQEPEDSITWHLGVGTGTGAEVANVNVSYAALGTSCVFQVTAEVFTAAS